MAASVPAGGNVRCSRRETTVSEVGASRDERGMLSLSAHVCVSCGHAPHMQLVLCRLATQASSTEHVQARLTVSSACSVAVHARHTGSYSPLKRCRTVQGQAAQGTGQQTRQFQPPGRLAGASTACARSCVGRQESRKGCRRRAQPPPRLCTLCAAASRQHASRRLW